MAETNARRVGGLSVLAVLVVVGVLLTGAGLALAADLTASFFAVVEADNWSPPSAGPSGITFYDTHGTMLVVDSDINNYWSEDTGIDIWEIDLDGNVVDSFSTGFAAHFREPTGIDYAPELDQIFMSNDDGMYFVYESGSDGVFGADDFLNPTAEVNVAGSDDTEDPVYDPGTQHLFVLDGGGTIYELNPSNGAVIDTIDLSGLGPSNWEGLAMTPQGELLVGANEDQQIYVLSTDGTELQPPISVANISAGGVDLQLVSGLGISAPGAGTGDYDIWIADRQDTSNNAGPPIDGRIWRLTTDGTPPTTTLPPTTTTTTTATTTTTQATTTTTSQGTTTTSPGDTTTTTLPGTPPPDPEPDGTFVDTNGHIFENAIEWLADKGITQGCNPPTNTRFCPDDQVTRGQMAAFLVRAFGYTLNGGGDLFTDDNSSVFENAIDRLATAGVTQGCNPPANTRFCPDDLVTRGQMAAFLGRAFNYTDNGGGDLFTDDDGSVFENAIDRLKTAGVTQGCNPPNNTRYCPDAFVTRGQMAAFLKRAFGE